MVTDERQQIRELGLRRIMRTRSSNTSQHGVRRFEVPLFNFNAEDYIDLIYWHKCALTEPPVTKSVSDADLEHFVRTRATHAIEFPCFPCHTQAVERCVKAVTEASIAVVGQEARDGFIRTRTHARAIMPTFNTKSEYHTTP